MKIGSAKTTTFLIGMLLLLSATSCKFIAFKTFGIKKLQELSSEEIAKQAKRYKIPKEQSFQIDTTFYQYLTSSVFDTIKEIQKNHFQPLQVLYYNSSGNLVSYQINCYTHGFPNLIWKEIRKSDTFPPSDQAQLDTLLPLAKHLEFIQPVNVSTSQLQNNQTSVILLWNRFMGRQSKRLIRHVQNNIKRTKTEEVQIIYVNTDLFFIQQMSDYQSSKK